MRFALIDTGPMVALFDPADAHLERYHALFTDLLKRRVELLTTWPCITEASYILSPRNHMALLEWLQTGAVRVQAFDTPDVGDMLAVMQRYTEPGKSLMDFADASLYWLANEMASNVVLSVDRRDFGRYRLPNGQAFEVL